MDELVQKQIYARIHQGHTFVVFLAQELLRNTNKTWGNGYSILTEVVVKNFMLSSVEKKADVCLIEVVRNNRVVLIIECKSRSNEISRGRRQLLGYMADFDCSSGFVMTAEQAIFCSIDIEDNERNENLDLNQQTGLERFIELVNEI